MATRRRAAEPEAAAEAGFPVDVRMPFDDGELLVSEASGAQRRYMIEGGVASASTRARLDELLHWGGVATITTGSPDGDGDAGNGDDPPAPDLGADTTE